MDLSTDRFGRNPEQRNQKNQPFEYSIKEENNQKTLASCILGVLKKTISKFC